MFDKIQSAHKVTKEEYREQVGRLRVDLLNTQFDLREASFRTLVILGGDDRPATNEVVDLLHEWMDARELHTHVFQEPTDEELERPLFWRYWRAMPVRGQIGLHVGGWLSDEIFDHAAGHSDEETFERHLDYLAQFERLLIDDGVLLLKFWFHRSKKAHKKRLKNAEEHPEEEIYVDDEDRELYRNYDHVMQMTETGLRRTDTTGAPWLVVDSSEREFRNLTVAKTLLTSIRERMEHAKSPGRVLPLTPTATGALDAVDLSAALKREEYVARLEAGQARLSKLSRKARMKGLSSVLVFEGWDAAGKGGCIRRLTKAMAARDYRVASIAAPTEEELAHHYLWRFWRQLPRAGRMVIFDRSWYGRVLVERVEGFAREDEWRRAYAEIKHFEAQLSRHGMPVLKFWLHLHRNEQQARFEAREKTPYKKYKITEEDYRNREKWEDYVAAVDEMVARTCVREAPWHLVPANDKRFARVRVLETVCDALEGAL
jgi:polyphosphate:AMP phosphotransferase